MIAPRLVHLLAVTALANLAIPAPRVNAQTPGSYEFIDFVAPRGWKVERAAEWVVFKKDDGTHYSNVFIIKPRPSLGTHRADVDKDWALHAAKQGLAAPAQSDGSSRDGWEVTVGAGATKGRNAFEISVTTFTGRGLSWALVGYYNDTTLLADMESLSQSLKLHEGRLASWREKNLGASAVAATDGRSPRPPATAPPAGPAARLPSSPSGPMMMTKSTTNFDDGWQATVQGDFVQVARPGLTVRLYHPNDALEQARPREVDAPEWYWSRVVEPAFRTSAAQKWEGVQYPPIYFMEGAGTDPQSGRAVHVAMKVVYEGGARVIVALANDRATFQQAFPHPNDMNRMLGYNKFAVTASDILGSWSKGGGGGVEYYNVYTGNYAGMAAVSSTDEFVFRPDGTYQSIHRSANTTNGSTRFSGLDYQGRYTVTDWSVTATNRVEGKTKLFHAQLEAIKGGYLLWLTDSDYAPLRYGLFRRPVP